MIGGYDTSRFAYVEATYMSTETLLEHPSTRGKISAADISIKYMLGIGVIIQSLRMMTNLEMVAHLFLLSFL